MIARSDVFPVCDGRRRAFWVGAWYGIVMEIMLPSITFFNLLLYPVAAIFSSLPFAGTVRFRRSEVDPVRY